MKFSLKPTIVTTWLLFAVSDTYGQSFVNLNFELANPVATTGYPNIANEVTASSAFPGWTVIVGGVQQNISTLNDPTAGLPWVALISQPTYLTDGPLNGSYSAFLEGPSAVNYASLSQTGVIPSGTQALLLDAISENYAGSVGIVIGTQQITLVPLHTYSTYTQYGANISAWAGDTEPLSVVVTGGRSGVFQCGGGTGAGFAATFGDR